jgi:hypothetical protein
MSRSQQYRQDEDGDAELRSEGKHQSYMTENWGPWGLEEGVPSRRHIMAVMEVGFSMEWAEVERTTEVVTTMTGASAGWSSSGAVDATYGT